MDLLSKITAPIGSVDSTTPATHVASVTETELVKPTTPAPVSVDAMQVDEANLLSPAPVLPSETVMPPAPSLGGEQTPDTGKRKRGRPFGSKNSKPSDGQATDSPSNVPNIGDIQTAAQAVVVDYKLMSEATFDLCTGIAATTIGPEWQARSEDEKQMVCVPLARYFEYKQVKDLPPNLALALVVVAYSAPRLREPGTASKLRLFWAWTKERIRSLRAK